MEANGARLKEDFKHKIYLYKKEAQKTKHWLRILVKAVPDIKQTNDLRRLWKECQELTIIFLKITS